MAKRFDFSHKADPENAPVITALIINFNTAPHQGSPENINTVDREIFVDKTFSSTTFSNEN